jgi:hypothetical protein
VEVTGRQVVTSVGSVGMDLALPVVMMQRKEVRIMKIRTSVLAGLLFLSSLGAVNSVIAEDGVLLKQEFTPGSYCHEKFRALRPSTLGTDDPTLKSSDSGDVIDFYGSCDESPVGQDQIQAQKMDAQRRWAQDYMD